MIKYRLFNPVTGNHTDYQDLDILKKDLPKVILDFYLHHCHNAPYSVITVNEDNSESWADPVGDDILDLKKVLEDLSKNI